MEGAAVWLDVCAWATDADVTTKESRDVAKVAVRERKRIKWASSESVELDEIILST
jgi:hypothetical protein